jgi:hypothetical protein
MFLGLSFARERRSEEVDSTGRFSWGCKSKRLDILPSGLLFQKAEMTIHWET